MVCLRRQTILFPVVKVQVISRLNKSLRGLFLCRRLHKLFSRCFLQMSLPKCLLISQGLGCRLIVSHIYFDDRPETYPAWRSSFQSIAGELSLKPAEELDLLITYLGKDSKRYVTSIRTSNAGNPSGAVYKIWQRLEERFGYPKLIEQSVKQRIV